MSDPVLDQLLDDRPARRARGTFKPGQSGNPSGRPKRLAELNALCQKNFPLALRRLRRLIKSPDDELSFRAIQFTFAYVMGKPPEAESLLHLENMRAKLTQLVIPQVPAAAPPIPLPEAVPETRVPQHPIEAKPQAPPEALEAVTPLQEPSGLPRHDTLRCIYRNKDGQCPELAEDGKQWCRVHHDKLFSMVSA